MFLGSLLFNNRQVRQNKLSIYPTIPYKPYFWVVKYLTKEVNFLTLKVHLIHLDKTNSFEIPNKVIDLGKEHQRRILEETSLGNFFKCEIRLLSCEPSGNCYHKNGKSRHWMPA